MRCGTQQQQQQRPPLLPSWQDTAAAELQQRLLFCAASSGSATGSVQESSAAGTSKSKRNGLPHIATGISAREGPRLQPGSVVACDCTAHGPEVHCQAAGKPWGAWWQQAALHCRTCTHLSCRNNTSDYYINSKKVKVDQVTTLLKEKGIDLDNNRFLILQVS